MSLVIMSAVVAKRLEKMQINFLWVGGSLERKSHLVNWDVVCSGKGQGLGLRKPTRMNRALLGKSIWRFVTDLDSIWKRLICYK